MCIRDQLLPRTIPRIDLCTIWAVGRSPLINPKLLVSACTFLASHITRDASAIKCFAFISSKKSRSIFKCVPLIVIRHSYAKCRSCVCNCPLKSENTIILIENFSCNDIRRVTAHFASGFYESAYGARPKRRIVRLFISIFTSRVPLSFILVSWILCFSPASGSRYPMAYICMPNVSFVFLALVLCDPVVVGAFCTL